jgi:hypothetical protein
MKTLNAKTDSKINIAGEEIEWITTKEDLSPIKIGYMVSQVSSTKLFF